MINLLPPEMKSGYRFAHANVILRKWVVMFAIAIVGLGAITTFGLLSIHQSSVRYEKQIAASNAEFKKENYTLTKQRVEDISGSFKLVVNVLSQEVLFSKLITQIGSAIPAKTNLTGLNISQTQGALDITANASDYATATQLQLNLADPKNKIFNKADIVNITCSSSNDPSKATSQFPCIVNLRALFSDNNSFLFINSSQAKP